LFTASAALFDSFAATDHQSIGLYLLVAVAALVQASKGIHKAVVSRIWLFLVLLLPITKLLTLGPRSTSSSNLGSSPSISIHPIAGLVEVQNSRFGALLSGQSKTLEEAVREYSRRYGRRPPPGFDRWYAIAQERGFLLIDEFDTIMQSLEPFWGVAASTLRARYRSIENAPDLIEFKVRKDKVDYTKDHYHAEFLMEWMNYTTWGDILPEVNFMISTLDEPRVVAPYDTVDLAIKNAEAQKRATSSRSNMELLHKSHGSTDPVKWISVGRQDAWEAVLSSCHIESPARSELVREGLNEQASLPFVSNTTTSMDVCGSPDLLHGHGFLASPESLTITHSLVPVFAQCKTSIFNDILYPSPYYEMQMESGDYDESKDSPFDEKLDRVYWAGSATGGYSTAQNWMQMHRQRLTMLTASDSDRPVSLLQKDERGFWQTVQSTWAEIAHLFYLKITNVVQCSEEACDAMKTRFSSKEGVMESEPKEATLESKYALDIDGNTFSGRYYRLLKSNVCVLKHTSFKEWHDGRLVPWVHYVPVSPGAEELGEMMRYLTQEEEGRGIGRRIAEQGREWARRTLRKEDLEVVFMRVLMEYARVMRDGRDELGFGGR
jgi:Glycosyl transferase family 90